MMSSRCRHPGQEGASIALFYAAHRRAAAPDGETGWAVTARGVKVSDAEMRELDIEHHDICPRWNYTIRPRGNHQWN